MIAIVSGATDFITWARSVAVPAENDRMIPCLDHADSLKEMKYAIPTTNPMKLKNNQKVVKIPKANKIARPMRRRPLVTRRDLLSSGSDVISAHPVSLRIPDITRGYPTFNITHYSQIWRTINSVVCQQEQLIH
jgi:hypothetical protein